MGNYDLVDTRGVTIKRRIRFSVFNEVEMLGTTCHGACCLIKTQSLRSINGYNESFDRQDGLFIFHTFKFLNLKIINVPEIIFKYTQHFSNLSRNKTDLHEVRSRILDYIAAKNEPSYCKSFIVVFPISDFNSLSSAYGGPSNLLEKIRQEIDNLKNLVGIQQFIIISDFVLSFEQDNYFKSIKTIEVSRDEDAHFYKNNLLSKVRNITQKIMTPDTDHIVIRNLDFPYTRFCYYRSCMAFKSLYPHYSSVTTAKIIGTIYENIGDTLHLKLTKVIFHRENDTFYCLSILFIGSMH